MEVRSKDGRHGSKRTRTNSGYVPNIGYCTQQNNQKKYYLCRLKNVDNVRSDHFRKVTKMIAAYKTFGVLKCIL